MNAGPDEHDAAILVTVRDVLGSAPREPGAWMLVTAAGSEGTIGGGRLEWRAMKAARAMIEDAGGPFRRELALPLGPALGQCCGGQVVLTLERLDPAGLAGLEALREAERARLPAVALFGAGHVGRAVAACLAVLPCRLRWHDARQDALPRPADAGTIETRHLGDPAEAVAALEPGSFVLVMTHDHPLDLELVAAALPRPAVAWVGMIGSATKRRRFEGQLRARGLPEPAIERLTCPIGMSGITGKAPAVIAASVTAQLLIAFEAAAAAAALRGAA